MDSKNPPLLSAIIPISRMTGRLEKLTQWLNDQSAKNLEIILVHDIQDEATGLELDNLIRSLDYKATIIECFAGNPGSARNVGLRAATGQWVVFWDSDDSPNLNETLECLKTNSQDMDLIIGSFTWISEVTAERTRSAKFPGEIEKALIAVGFNPGIWRMVFRRNFIGKTEFYPLKMAEDQMFIADILVKNPKIVFIEENLYNYYFGSSNHQVNNNEAQFDLIKTFKICTYMYNQNLPHKNDYIATILIRQFFSIQKFLPLKNKLGSTMTLIKFVISNKFKIAKTSVVILSLLRENRNHKYGR